MEILNIHIHCFQYQMLVAVLVNLKVFTEHLLCVHTVQVIEEMKVG